MFSVSNKRPIINDPVHGFITIPCELVYSLVQHPWFQRLGRIRQLGLAGVVYPGAVHTRFQHSLGAMHLAYEAVKLLRQKGHTITPAEENGVLAAMLLHDIGHGPFSHVLENMLLSNVSHEDISAFMMQRINEETGGRLDTAIRIFNDVYPKRFLHQLISSQLDMDRMDYLCRDCFYTGVSEGAIGTGRIIKMLEVWDDRLVVEAKGIYTIESFLTARRLMYWQVYLHKTSVAAERMLVKILTRARHLISRGHTLCMPPSLHFFLSGEIGADALAGDPETIANYVNIDDSDIMSSVKVWASDDDVILAELCRRFVDRRLFKAVTGGEREMFDIGALKRSYAGHFGIDPEDACYFFETDTVSSKTYNPNGANIMILYPDGHLEDVARASDMFSTDLISRNVSKSYLIYMPV
ncbi:MAG: HD domain-containing protein [Candidatus Aphodosoma sp.]